MLKNKKLIGIVIVAVALIGWFFTGQFRVGLQTEIVQPIISKSFDGETIYNPNKTATSKSFTRWVNYRTTEGWAEIDTSFTQVADGFVMDKAPFTFKAPLTSTGAAVFVNNNRWDPVADKQITSDPLTMTIEAQGVSDVPGRMDVISIKGKPADVIIYPNAYPNADLIYYIGFGKGPQLEKLVRINSAPVGDAIYTFKYSFDKQEEFSRPVSKKQTKWTEQSVMGTKEAVAVKPVGEIQKRGIGFAPARVWDSGTGINGPKVQSIQVDYEPIGGNRYMVSKTVPASFFSDAVFPVFTDVINKYFPEDADHGTLVDGRVQCYSGSGCGDGSFLNGRDQLTGSAVDETTGNQNAIGIYGASGYEFTRTFLTFRTGDGIESTDDINEVKLGIYITAKTNADNSANKDYLAVVNTNPASDTALATADYDTITDTGGTNPHAANTDFKMMMDASTSTADWIDITNITLNQYTEFVFNSVGRSYITKGVGGISNFGVVLSADALRLDCCSGGYNQVTIDFAEGTNSPYLEIDFASGAPAAVSSDSQDQIIPWTEI